MAFSVIYAHTAFVSLGANKVKPKMLEKAVNDDPAIVTALDRLRVENPGSGSVPEVDDPTGRTWAFIFVGAGPLSGPESTALDALVAAHTGVETYDPSPRNGGSAGQFWSNVDGTSYAWATPPGAGGGEANTTSNVGATGTGLARTKIGTDLPISKIAGVGGITETLVSDSLQVDGTALLPRDGSRAMTAGLDMGGFAISNVGNVDGRDISADATTWGNHIASSAVHVPTLGTALQVLRVNAGATATEWSTPVDGVTAPGTTVVGRVPTFADVTGDALAQSSVSISGGAVTGVTTLTASGSIVAFNVIGTNTGDQTITLTGDVTGSGTGSFAATITADSVTYAKIQNVSAASRLLGRGSAAGSGDVQELTLSGGLSIAGTAVSSDALLPRDGTRAMTGALDMGAQAITNVGNVDGRDISADATTWGNHIASSVVHVPALGTAGQVLAVNAGATGTEWVAAGGGGSPGGVDGDVQMKSGSSFAAVPGYRYNASYGLVITATEPSGVSPDGPALFADFWEQPTFTVPGQPYGFDHGSISRSGFASVGGGSTTVRNIGGMTAGTASGTVAGSTYALTSARTAAQVVAYTPSATANTASSGFTLSSTSGRAPLNSEPSNAAYRCRFSARFAVNVTTASNARFFVGLASSITSFTANPTSSTSGMGTRMGIGFGDGNAAVLHWITTQTGEANSVVSTGITAVDGNMYHVEMMTVPNSAFVYGRLWVQSAAGGDWSLSSSYAYDTTANVLASTNCGYGIIGGNGSTAAAALTVYPGHFAVEVR